MKLTRLELATVSTAIQICSLATTFAEHTTTGLTRGFVSERPADNWEEALISGNGTIGALVMGRPLQESIIFNHERLFMPWDANRPVVNMAPHLPAVRRMIEAGRYREAAAIPVELSRKEGYRGMRWTDPLVPAFELQITMGSAGELRGYERSVDFETGVTSVRWLDDGGEFRQRLFVSRADNVAVLSLHRKHGRAINCRIALAMTSGDEKIASSKDKEDEAPHIEGVEYVHRSARGSLLTYRCLFSRRRPDTIAGYEGAANVITSGGSLATVNDSIVVKGASEVLIFVTLDVLNDADASVLDEMVNRLEVLPADFNELLTRHEAIHGEIFRRTRLDLGGGQDHQLSSEALLRKSHVGSLNAALLEKEFDAGRYAILSSSNELPPTLQGVWSGTWFPPWQSDYTHNGNVPSAIASMLMANMPECMESYLGYMESLVPHFRENAQKLFGCRGIMVPSRTSSHGYNTHFDEEYIHLFWTPGAAWAAHFFYDYYLYTGDEEFLRTRALPFMKEAALFYENFLYEGLDGRYVFNPSYSPENMPANSDSQACINATMDIALVKDLLNNLIIACDNRGIEPQGVQRWKTMLQKMPAYQINRDGTVAEWTTKKLVDNHEHRHVSHLAALYDGLPEEIAVNLSLRNAFKEVIERRMRARRADGGGDMSFGLVQLGQAAASLGEAELAYEAIDMLANVYWRPNLVSTHNPGSIFNVDICGGMPAVIIKMLVDSRPGEITLLPALPRQWPTGSIQGVLCRGQIEVESLAWDGTDVTVELRSKVDQTVKLCVHGGIRLIAVEGGQAAIDGQFTKAGSRLVTLVANQTVTLRIVRQDLPRE